MMTYSKTIKCPKCGIINESLEAVEVHGKPQRVNPTDCSHCGLVFSQYYGLKFAPLKPVPEKPKKEIKKVVLPKITPEKSSQKNNDSSSSQKAEIEIVVVHQDDRIPKPLPDKVVKPDTEQIITKQKRSSKTGLPLPAPFEYASKKNIWVIKWLDILSWFCLIPGIIMGVIKLTVDIIQFNSINLMTMIAAAKYMVFGGFVFLFFKWMVLITQTIIDMHQELTAILNRNDRHT